MKLRIPYWKVLALPVFLFVLGYCSNQAVLIANHGKFPVMVNEVQQVEHQKQMEVSLGDIQIVVPSAPVTSSQYLGDDVHSVMGPNSHLKALADIFALPQGTASIGDFLILAGEWLWSYCPIIWLTLVLRKVFGVD